VSKHPYKAPGLNDGYDKDRLVDEVEVYRAFGGCLPVRMCHRTESFFLKSLRQLNGQREERSDQCKY